MSEANNRRIPNLLHLLLFLGLTLVVLVVCEAGGLALAHGLAGEPLRRALADQKLQMMVNAVGYGATLALAVPLFAAVWQRPALVGVRWNSGAARPWLVGVGLVLGLVSDGVSSLLPTPNKMPLEDVFRTPGVIWLLVAFGTVLAPLFEEVVFRGFLLPGVAILVDWLRLPRGEAAAEVHRRWQEGEGYSRGAVVVGSGVTSVLFALLHAPQLGLNWAPVALLVVVSLVLCWVRVRWDSVAASTLVHGAYNFSVFVVLFVATGGFRHMDRI